MFNTTTQQNKQSISVESVEWEKRYPELLLDLHEVKVGKEKKYQLCDLDRRLNQEIEVATLTDQFRGTFFAEIDPSIMGLLKKGRRVRIWYASSGTWTNVCKILCVRDLGAILGG